MNCIIVDDEPLAREAIEMLVSGLEGLHLAGQFNNAVSAGEYIGRYPVDLVFLDIQMPGLTGLEFARTIPRKTLVIFTTAYTEYAAESYDIDAIDYLVKPVEAGRFHKAVEKAKAYHALLHQEKMQEIEGIRDDFMFIKADRRYFRVEYKDILFIEGLKDYSIIQMVNQRIITRMNLKTIGELLPAGLFLRTAKSFIVNVTCVDSFDNNDIFIGPHELAIGASYRDALFDCFALPKRGK